MGQDSYEIGSLTVLDIDGIISRAASDATAFLNGIDISTKDYKKLVKYYFYKRILDSFKGKAHGAIVGVTTKSKSNDIVRDVLRNTSIKVVKPITGTAEEFILGINVSSPEYDDMVSEGINYTLAGKINKLLYYFHKNGLTGLVREYSSDNAKIKLFK